MEVKASTENQDALIQRALKAYNNKKEYDKKYQAANREKLNKYNMEYLKKLKEDKTSEQYQKILANQRRYYNNVYKISKKEKEKEEQDRKTNAININI